MRMYDMLRAMDKYTGKGTTYYHYDGLAGCITHIKAHNGADVRVWKATEAGYDPEGGPFVTVCHTHGTIHNWPLLRDAIRRAPLTEWCEECHQAAPEFVAWAEAHQDDPEGDELAAAYDAHEALTRTCPRCGEPLTDECDPDFCEGCFQDYPMGVDCLDY
jgi:hypothetical protein